VNVVSSASRRAEAPRDQIDRRARLRHERIDREKRRLEAGRRQCLATPMRHTSTMRERSTGSSIAH
jgi:hypothetical protein